VSAVPGGALDLTVRIHHETDGGALWAEVLELPGLFASGDDRSELEEALREALALYLAEGDSPAQILEIHWGSSREVEVVDEAKVAVAR
jgi:predicted RNase H-like HicB family nuclease